MILLSIKVHLLMAKNLKEKKGKITLSYMVVIQDYDPLTSKRKRHTQCAMDAIHKGRSQKTK